MKRIIELDLIRVLAFIMVVVMHSPMPGDQTYGLFISAISFFTMPCIGLFFMVSGALLLPVKTDGLSFLKKRLDKVLAPTLVWSLVYLALKFLVAGSADGLWYQLISIPFSAQGHGIMWFMYVLIGLYLVSPVISAWLTKCGKKELEFYLLLWLVTTLFPLLEHVVEINNSVTGMLYYFSGYLGYFVLGFYLRNYTGGLVERVLTHPVTVIATLCAPVVCKLGHIQVDFYSVFYYLSIFTVVMCATWFKLLSRYGAGLVRGPKLQSFVVLVSNLSFGMYLCHIVIMRYVLWKLPVVANMGSYVGQTLTIILLTILGSFILCWAISRFRMGKWIIGYSVKK